jgi:pyruvate,orthophosphate dikinase
MDSPAKVKSKALEVNIAESHVEVEIDPRYDALQEVMRRYFGLMEGLQVFLRELSHPYMNWRFIVTEARKYALDYFHLFRGHPRGPEAAALMAEIFLQAVRSAKAADVKRDGVDNLMLYLQAVVREAGADFARFHPVLTDALEGLRELPAEEFELLVRSFYSAKRLAGAYLALDPGGAPGSRALNELLAAYLERTYAYWLGEEDPRERFVRDAAEFDFPAAAEELFAPIAHRRIAAARSRLEEIRRRMPAAARETTAALLELPGFADFVEGYKRVPEGLLQASPRPGQGQHFKLIFLFQIVNLSGLVTIHEEALREINQTLSWIILNENYRHLQNLIRKTFSILKERSGAYPATALNGILTLGRGVYKTDEIDLVNFFIDRMVDFGFHAPMVRGVDDAWQIQVDSAHLQNIRTWLELIKLNPKRSTRLLSALIIHLSLSGVFIRDIDLFPRDITGLLNSRIQPVYHLVKQLARLLPAFFNDIGAEGRLRDISTRIDELTQRRDRLVHFLRKQSHVESSNRIILLVEAVFRFWETRRQELLAPFVPPGIYGEIEPEGAYVAGMHRAARHLAAAGCRLPEDLLALGEDEAARLLAGAPGVDAVDRQRFALAVELYRLLHQKYQLDVVEMKNYLSQLRTEALPDFPQLERALERPDPKERLIGIMAYLEKLKGVILSETAFAVREDIYQKRHITIDIPSMYGSYHEMKFDCLGLTLRLEAMVNVLFENLIGEIDLGLITKATFSEILELLVLFDQALRLDGITSAEFAQQLAFLDQSVAIKGFTLTQYLDIFKGFTLAVQNIITDYFHTLHGANLDRILDQLDPEGMLEKFRASGAADDPEKFRHRVSEIFFRDRIASALGLQQLDLFLTRILNTLFQQSTKLHREHLRQLLLYDPNHAMVDIDQPLEPRVGVIHLGTKGFNLCKLHRLGFRVPPGFIITTEVFRCREVIESYAPADRNFRDQITRHIARLERTTGRRLGDPQNPLLLSVRSGASISQPGMMDTLLNVGNNEAITTAVAARMGNPWFAWDNYRRFLQTYGMAHGLERDAFDAIINDTKRRLGIPLKRLLTGEQMRAVALAYKAMVQDAGIAIMDTPYEQLYLAIRTVLASWHSPKAEAYRRIMGISDDWGTAVAIQAMVYGNISPQSGTGVIFTHNARWSADVLRLWGDFTTANQGEDVVSGLVKTMPISLFQQEIEMRETDVTLETHFPEIYGELKRWAHLLIDEHGWSPQEIEFTFESPSPESLYILQTRDMAMRESRKNLRFEFEGDRGELLLGHGIGVSGGAMSGRLVFNLDEIQKWREQDPGTHLILARADTVPDDIREIHAADGVLTERGGLTSHAAVVAHRLGKTCVVGCGGLICDEKARVCRFGRTTLASGDFISIDGQEGSVYRGPIKVKEAVL